MKEEHIINDPNGFITLKAISSANKFNLYMFQKIKPFISSGKVIEIGSGIGNISTLLLESFKSVTLSDYNNEYTSFLKQSFNSYPHVMSIESIDLVDKNFDEKYSHLLNLYDSLISLNVVEHIENDNLALQNCKKLVKKGGTVIILVPACRFLFNSLDVSLGHFKRYTKNTLMELFIQNKFEIIHSQYFNAFGTLGWFIFGNIFRKKKIESNQMKLYDFILPIVKGIDVLMKNIFGLSVIVVGKVR